MGTVAAPPQTASRRTASREKATALRIRARPARQQDGAELVAHEGEIIGLTGLSGHGQTQSADRYLSRIDQACRPGQGDCDRSPSSPATVSRTEFFRCGRSPRTLRSARSPACANGIFISPNREAGLARQWQERIGIRTPDIRNNILSLSGGNQQKALFARALASDASIILMDDPMRGVDVATKFEVYELIEAEASAWTNIPLVHDRNGRAAKLRSRLCLSRRTHRRKAQSR